MDAGSGSQANGKTRKETEMKETIVILWGLAVTVFWMVCVWRGMRAHEKLADSVEQMSRKQQ